MKLKLKYIYYICSLIGLSGLTSCNDFLDREPITNVTPDAYFTTADQVGAFGLKPGTMQGEILLNLDSEDEGELYIGCAGGLDITATLEYKEEMPMVDFVARKITLKGLRGGHSGLEINEGRGNANKLLARIVHDYGEVGLWTHPDHISGELHYFFGFLTDSTDSTEIPDGFHKVEIPAGRYAVFTIKSQETPEKTADAVRDGWRYVFTEWLRLLHLGER